MNLSLTEQMISDFSPYLKDPDSFRKKAMADASGVFGPIVSIETISFKDGTGIAEKIYHYECGATRKLDAVRAGVKSL